jgi:hypothetical protein
MLEENFEYMGFIIKVIPIKLASRGNSDRPRFISIAIVGMSWVPGRHQEKWLRPGRISSSPQRALKHGRQFAMRALDDGLCCTTFSDLMLNHA